MQPKLTRRQALFGGAAALASLTLRQIPASAKVECDSSRVMTTTHPKEDTMPTNVLIAYATRAGSTREVAERMATVLQAKGMQATVMDAKKCRTVAGYDAVIVGAGVRMGSIYGEATRLVKRNQAALSAVPTAFFSVSLGAKETDAESIEQVEGLLDRLEALVAPVSSADFAGVLDISRLGPLFRWTMSKAAEAEDGMQEGDFRDWDAIEVWTEALF